MARDSFLLAVVTVLLNGAAQLMLRGAALRGASPTSPLELAKSPLFLLAITSYGLSVLTWLAVLKRVPLTIAMPFVALVYVLVPIAAKFVFDDALTWRMGLGMALVATGVVIVAYR